MFKKNSQKTIRAVALTHCILPKGYVEAVQQICYIHPTRDNKTLVDDIETICRKVFCDRYVLPKLENKQIDEKQIKKIVLDFHEASNKDKFVVFSSHGIYLLMNKDKYVKYEAFSGNLPNNEATCLNILPPKNRDVLSNTTSFPQKKSVKKPSIAYQRNNGSKQEYAKYFASNFTEKAKKTKTIAYIKKYYRPSSYRGEDAKLTKDLFNYLFDCFNNEGIIIAEKHLDNHINLLCTTDYIPFSTEKLAQKFFYNGFYLYLKNNLKQDYKTTKIDNFVSKNVKLFPKTATLSLEQFNYFFEAYITCATSLLKNLPLKRVDCNDYFLLKTFDINNVPTYVFIGIAQFDKEIFIEYIKTAFTHSVIDKKQKFKVVIPIEPSNVETQRIGLVLEFLNFECSMIVYNSEGYTIKNKPEYLKKFPKDIAKWLNKSDEKIQPTTYKILSSKDKICINFPYNDTVFCFAYMIIHDKIFKTPTNTDLGKLHNQGLLLVPILK